MGRLLELNKLNRISAARRADPVWKRHFSADLNQATRLDDLPGREALELARLDPPVMDLVYDLIVRTLDLGPPGCFSDLSGEPKVLVLDISLFLVDQFRWEILKRLNWIHGFPAEAHPLIDLIIDFKRIKTEFKPPFPELNESHPGRAEFVRRRNIDGEAMIREMIPKALTAFGQIA